MVVCTYSWQFRRGRIKCAIAAKPKRRPLLRYSVLENTMGAGGTSPAAVQEPSLAHLIDPTRKWYNNRRYAPSPVAHCRIHTPRRLIALNAWIVLLYVWKNPHLSSDSLTSTDSLITSSTTGYDGSMMNGLQSLTQWESAFNYPSGGNLGLLNAIQVSFLTIYSSSPLTIADDVEHRCIGRVSICTIHVRWHRPSSSSLVRCSHHVYCDRHSDCFPVCRNVHWCSFLNRLWEYVCRQVL